MACDTTNTTPTRLALGDRTNTTSARVFDDWRPTCEALRRKRTREDSEDDYSPPSSSPTKGGSAELNREMSLIEAVAPVQASRKRARNSCTHMLIRDSLSALRPPTSLPSMYPLHRDHCLPNDIYLLLSQSRRAAFSRLSFLLIPPMCTVLSILLLALLSTAPIVMVSRSDILPDEKLTPSAGAKSGQNSLLAIVTEHGAVEICNAAKRDTWDLGRSGQPCISIPNCAPQNLPE